jgi:hypothetical protein
MTAMVAKRRLILSQASGLPEQHGGNNEQGQNKLAKQLWAIVSLLLNLQITRADKQSIRKNRPDQYG